METSSNEGTGKSVDAERELMQAIVDLVNREVSIDQVDRDDCFVADDGTVGVVVDQSTFQMLS